MSNLQRQSRRSQRCCTFSYFCATLLVVLFFVYANAFPSVGVQFASNPQVRASQRSFVRDAVFINEPRKASTKCQHRLSTQPSMQSTTTKKKKYFIVQRLRRLITSGFPRLPGKPWSSNRVLRKVMLLLVGMLVLLATPMAAHASTVAETAAGEVANTAGATIASIAARPVSAMVELQLTFRLVYAALIGAGLGKERSLAKHSAGVRTMALVAMGASAFTVCSTFGFLQFPGCYDPSRMAANVASGVGFVGAGVITTSSAQQLQQGQGGSSTQPAPNVVHGLTTAATIWLSAAVGVACGVGLYAVATTASLVTISILRLGRITPKAHSTPKTASKGQSDALVEHHAHRRAGSDNSLDTAQDHDYEHYAETHDTSVWDEHPNHENQEQQEEENNSFAQDNHPVEPVVSASPSNNSRRKPYVSKTPRSRDDPVIRIVKHAWQGNNSTSDGVFFAYDDMQDMNLDDLEQFIKKRRRSSTSPRYRPDGKDDRLSP